MKLSVWYTPPPRCPPPQVHQTSPTFLPAPTAISEAELRTANPLMMLLRSLLPWVNAGLQPDYGEGGGAGGGGPAAAEREGEGGGDRAPG